MKDYYGDPSWVQIIREKISETTSDHLYCVPKTILLYC